MLTYAEAHEELGRLRTQGNLVDLLPAGWRRAFDRHAQTLAAYLSWEQVEDRDLLELAAHLDELNDRKLRSFVKGFAPAVAEEIARSWRGDADMPYQVGWERRPFRHPDPRAGAHVRIDRLRSAIALALPFPGKGLDFLAAWAPYLEPGTVGVLLASEIRHGRREWVKHLIDHAEGRVRTGGMGAHVTVGLLAGDDPAGWSYVEDLLVRAQRQEGLRQTILETVDLAHRVAFRRMLGVILDNGLTRFAATARAAGVWFGEPIDVGQERELRDHLARLADHLDRPGQLPTSGPEDTFLGLWAAAFHDASRATHLATDVLRGGTADERLAAVRLLAALGLDEGRAATASAFGDSDQRVVAAALTAWPVDSWRLPRTGTLAPGPTRALLGALGSATRGKQQIGVLAPREVAFGPSVVADVLVAYGDPTVDLSAAEAKAGAEGRAVRARRLAEDPAQHRSELIALVGDAAELPRSIAVVALEGIEEITAAEALVLEGLLTRKSSPVRKACLGLLSRQPRNGVAASVDRLASGTAEQLKAGEALARAAGLVTEEAAPALPVLAAMLGLDHSRRTPSVRPMPRGDFRRLHRPVQVLVTSLLAWLDEHKDVEVTIHDWAGSSEVQLLADVRWLGQNAPDGSMPLQEIIGPWWERAEPLLPDRGLEIVLLAALLPDHRRWVPQQGYDVPKHVPAILGDLPARYRDGRESGLAPAIIARLATQVATPDMADPMLDVLDTVLAALPTKGYAAPEPVLRALGEPIPENEWMLEARDPRSDLPHRLIERLSTWFTDGMLSEDQERRFWLQRRFADEPLGRHDPAVDRMVASPPVAKAYGVPLDSPLAQVPVQPNRWVPPAQLLLAANRRGLATRDDVVDALIRPDSRGRGLYGENPVSSVTTRRRPPWLADDEPGSALVAEVCAAALDIERRRDDLDTTATHVVRALRSARGCDVLFKYLTALGRDRFTRGYSWSGGRTPALSRVVRMVVPADDDTVDTFRAAATSARITERRLIELGVYAPQWSSYVEQTIEWPGYADAVWWLHAHTKGDDWTVDQDLREEWESEVSRRTPLDSVDLVRGAADVAWYRTVVDTLGTERFDALLKVAKYASSSGGHKRAELFAEALSGRVTATELADRMAAKRHQDSVRALGLVPLADQADLLRRYELLAGFVASDRSSGSQRRASESTAVEIGMENLARAAGYRDPQRLVWAMEAAAVADLAHGPVVVADGDLEVSLAIVDGAPAIEVRRAGRALKSVPRSHAKEPAFAALRERATRLRKQASRMRRSLESACVAGEPFTADEVAELHGHPLLRPMLQDLIGVDGEGRCGFFGDAPGTLVGAEGEAFSTSGPIRIAHPHDLLASGQWPELQHVLFAARRRQPFRQAFRELYVPTETERTERGLSRRYAGHQVQPRQAAGLFRSRGWVADFETGFAKTFHGEKITAVASLLNGWGSPTEAEDGQLDVITFQRAGSDQLIALEDVPPRLFSEVMRDLDLVVSVAHSGGVDPETSASTVEVRGRLVAETCELLALTNVELTDHHALVKGTLGTYSVNLGSGVVHRQPGNAICIVPVHAQQRGRVFLPFVDDDPRTAEVISKVVLLSRDDKIQDPTILDQLRR